MQGGCRGGCGVHGLGLPSVQLSSNLLWGPAAALLALWFLLSSLVFRRVLSMKSRSRLAIMAPKAEKKPAQPAARPLNAKVCFALSGFVSQSCLKGLSRNSTLASY